jgi:hypothetical protein
MVDAVYVDTRQTKSIVAIKLKTPFKSVFQVAVSHKESKIRILNELVNNSTVFLVEMGEGRLKKSQPFQTGIACTADYNMVEDVYPHDFTRLLKPFC